MCCESGGCRLQETNREPGTISTSVFFREQWAAGVINAETTTSEQADTVVAQDYGIEITYAHSLAFLSSGNMGKNKQKGKKQKNVFQVANKHLKPKNKAKPVTTTLKHVRSLFSGVFSFFLGYILYSLLVCSACSVHFSIICAFTDQCGEKREGGEPQSDFHRSPEGC